MASNILQKQSPKKKMKYLITISGIDFEFMNQTDLIKLIEQKIVEISAYKEHNSLTILQLAYLTHFLQ